MAIIRTMTEWDFVACERLQQNFTIDGLREMFRFYDEIGMDIEWDPIAFCCEWREETPDYIRQNMYDVPEEEEVIDFLSYRTTAIQLDNGNIMFILF